MKVRWGVGIGLCLVGFGLSACGSATNSSDPNSPMSTYNLVACSAVDGMFIDMAANKTVPKSTALNMLDYGKKAENPGVRRAANLLQEQVNAKNQVGVNTAIAKYAEACHAIGNGPGDNAG